MKANKIKIEIKSRLLGNVLFEYEAEDNTITKTMETAINSNVDLNNADLRNADLRNANLNNANLNNADLRGAKLICANLNGADLSNANISNTDLRDVDLIGANLRNADLSGANLRNADLRNADLSGANLRKADLIGTDLSGANFSGADVNSVHFVPLACPSDGAFVGWKKVRNDVSTYLVKLSITEDSKRSSATRTKCRCDKAVVLAIFDMRNNMAEVKRCVNHAFDQETEYIVGEVVTADKWDENRWNECSNGIHFFVNKQEALNY